VEVDDPILQELVTDFTYGNLVSVKIRLDSTALISYGTPCGQLPTHSYLEGAAGAARVPFDNPLRTNKSKPDAARCTTPYHWPCLVTVK